MMLPGLGKIAIVGAVAAAWEQIKTVLLKFYSLFFVTIKLSGWGPEAMKIYLQNCGKRSFLGEKSYQAMARFVRTTSRHQLVLFECVPEQTTIWWLNKKPLITSVSKNGDFAVTYIRGFFNAEKLLLNAVNLFNDFKIVGNEKDISDRFVVYKKYGSIGSFGSSRNHKKDSNEETKPSSSGNDRGWDDAAMDVRLKTPIGWKRENIGQPIRKNAIRTLSLGTEPNNVIDDAIKWKNSENWYKERFVPWKRGYLLHGLPGTGKTIFSRCLAQELNIPIFSFDISTMTNKDFADSWKDAMNYTPCMILIEDLDAVFKGRKNIAVKTGFENGLTFDSFLNTIDGVENTDGIILIITTNNIDLMDPAIGIASSDNGVSTRPGRIDKSIKFELLDKDGKQKMAQRIFSGINNKYWKDLLIDDKQYTGAQFQEKCTQRALDIYWKETN